MSNDKKEIKELVYQKPNPLYKIASGEITASCFDTIVLLLSNIDQETKETGIIKIRTALQSELKGVYVPANRIRKNLDELKMMNFVNPNYDEDGTGPVRERAMSFIEYFDDYKNGNIDVKLTGVIMPYFFDLKQVLGYAEGNSVNTIRLKKTTTKMIYEFCLKWKRNKNKVKEGLTIKYDELREYLLLPENKYARFTDFKKRVLEEAKEDINSLGFKDEDVNQDFMIDYKVNKKGRNVESITFFINIIVDIPTEKQKEIVKKFDKKKIKHFRNEVIWDGELDDFKVVSIILKAEATLEGKQMEFTKYINRTLMYVYQKSPSNFYGYFIKAIESNYIKAE